MAITDLCGRCLVYLNYSLPPPIAIRDGHRDHATMDDLGVIRLRNWATRQIELGATDFEMGQTQERIIPVSTYGGDAVCGYHLHVLVEREIRMTEPPFRRR